MAQQSLPASVKFNMQGAMPIAWKGIRRQGIQSHSTTVHIWFYENVSSMKKEILQAKGSHKQNEVSA